MGTHEFVAAINKASAEALAEPPFGRGHLGASILGRRCARAVWYSFRWHRVVKHQGRLLRLFSRGHEEEFRIAKWLRAIPGVEVRDYQQRLMWRPDRDQYTCIDWNDDPDRESWVDVSLDAAHIRRASANGNGPRQWGFSEGHLAGACDGVVRGVEEWYPETKELGWGLLECKTSNDKGFQRLRVRGVVSEKLEHFVQMQIYMGALGLRWGIYIAVNKNDDDLYVELVHFKEEVFAFYLDRADKIIGARKPPPRLNEDPSWWECKFCDFRQICHYDEEPLRHCRTCTYSSAESSGRWACNLHVADIPESFQPKGCDDWEPTR